MIIGSSSPQILAVNKKMIYFASYKILKFREAGTRIFENKKTLLSCSKIEMSEMEHQFRGVCKICCTWLE